MEQETNAAGQKQRCRRSLFAVMQFARGKERESLGRGV
jgi:hypothetical protein